MSYEKLIEGFNLKIEGRFNVDSSLHEYILSLCPEEIMVRKVFRLERITDLEIKTRKTVLVVGIEDDTQTIEAFRWAALTKEIMIDPESSDLYLFIYFNQAVQLEVCMKIESTEQFCRKFVVHQDETVEHFLERTFLAKPISASGGILSADPLMKSLLSVESEHSWFKTEEQKKWKEILLSGLTGAELIEELFKSKKYPK